MSPRSRRLARPERLPLSPAQARLWFLHRLGGSAVTYAVPLLLRLHGPLDEDALGRALTALARRHEILRTCYPEHEGRPVQQVLPEAAPVPLTTTALNGESMAQAARRLAAEPFDLADRPPLRAHLLTGPGGARALLLVLHHIAHDEASTAPLVRDLGLLYAAELDPDLPELKPSPPSSTPTTPSGTATPPQPARTGCCPTGAPRSPGRPMRSPCRSTGPG